MIFFDIDGTLADNKSAERAAALAFQKEHGEIFPGSPDEFVNRWQAVMEKYFRQYLAGEISFQGQRRARIREMFSHRGTLTDLEADAVFAKYLKRYEENWRLFGDVKSCLTSLSDYRLGIISNGDALQQRDKLKVLRIAEYFSVILISGDIGIAKPDSRIFTTACQAAQQQPDECVYVGDDFETDVAGSRQAGMRGVWLNRDGTSMAENTDVITTLAELQERFGQ